MHFTVSSSSGDNSLGIIIFMFLVGGTLIIDALKKIKRRRQIENIPRSKIKSAAINELVELHCQVIQDRSHYVSSPLSNALCNAYIWKFERLIKTKNGANWRHMFYFFSQDFLLVEDEDDPSSQAAIRLDQCRIEHIEPHKVVEFNNGSYDLPDEVLQVFKASKLFDVENKKFFLFRAEMRLKEILLYPEKKLFVMGTAYSPSTIEGKKLINSKKIKFGQNNEVKVSSSQWKKFMKDNKVLKHFDKNKDGLICEEEEKELIQKLNDNYKKYAPKIESKYDFSKIKIVMGRSLSRLQLFDTPDVLVSGQSEVKLRAELFVQSKFKLLLGSVLTSVGIYRLIKMFI